MDSNLNYRRSQTCPFCGGRLRSHHPRQADGKMMPLQYQCQTCNRTPREALAALEEAMKTNAKTAKTTKTTATKQSRKAPAAIETPVAETKPRKTRYEELVDEGVIAPYPGSELAEARAAEAAATPEPTAPASILEAQDGVHARAVVDAPTPDAPETKTDAGETLCTFAFRLAPGERDEIHRAAGKGGASKFVKAVALAVARGDGQAIQEHLDRVLSAINDRIVAEQSR